MSTITVERPVEVRPVTAADLLSRAADILEEFDWKQGSAGSREEGSMCAVGAIYAAADDAMGARWWDTACHDALIAFGQPTVEAGMFPLAEWNDEPGRTKAEVVAKLRELAVK